MVVNILKLSDLKNPESFVQLDLVRGFKYVDLAGEIVNHYCTDQAAPQFNMGLEGLVISKPLENVEAIKITPTVFWMKFAPVNSLESVQHLFNKESSFVLNTLSVGNVKRVGWRHHFFYEFKNEAAFNKYFSDLFSGQKIRLNHINLSLETSKDFKANLEIKPVLKASDTKTKAVMFDIDIFKEGDINKSVIETTLKSFADYLRGKDEFLGLLNMLPTSHVE